MAASVDRATLRAPRAAGAAPRRRGIARVWLGVAAALAVPIGVAAWERVDFGLWATPAMPDVLRASAVALALFALCGYVPARTLVPRELAAHATLLALPLGAIASALELAVLGLLHVPFGVSLPLVLGGNAVSAVALRVRRRPLARPAEPARTRLLWPVCLGLAIGVVVLTPSLRAGFATVPGQNGDAVLAVGSAELVKHAPPTAIRPDQPIDRIPLAWRSKYPIFYPLAATSELSGLSVIASFGAVCAALLALAAFGFLLLARHPLRAPPAVALAAMALVGLQRVPVSFGLAPFYNQLWALLALPLTLVAAWAFLRAPGGRTAGLLALAAVAAAFAYPLMLAFPAAYLAVGGWRALRSARAAGRRADWRAALRGPRRLAWAAGAVGALAVCAVLIRGVGEKTISAAAALSPWGDLSGWSGSALPYLPFPRFLGLPDGGGWAWLAVAAIALAAAWGLARAPRATAVPLGATVLGALAFALYFRLRAQAQLFYFKDLGFAGPLVVTLAVVGAGDLIGRARARAPAPGRSRWVAGLAAAGLAAVAVTSFVATRRDVAGTFEQASTSPTPSPAARPTTSSPTPPSLGRPTRPAAPCSPTRSSGSTG
ncbi:MAG: hypothetical protein E6G30_10455 [Actinobacteria bacterium]|nr:MAG: hypothetical protein E6G30_10455 [Actinomycetota bacterium]